MDSRTLPLASPIILSETGGHPDFPDGMPCEKRLMNVDFGKACTGIGFAG